MDITISIILSIRITPSSFWLIGTTSILMTTKDTTASSQSPPVAMLKVELTTQLALKSLSVASFLCPGCPMIQTQMGSGGEPQGKLMPFRSYPGPLNTSLVLSVTWSEVCKLQ